MAKKQKQDRKPRPEMLGSGSAYKAASKISERKAKQDCIINGGTWKPGIGCIQ